MDNKKFLMQIEQYYNGNLKSNRVIIVGDTSNYLRKIGMDNLPVVIKQSTLSKCIREPRGSRSAHELDRVVIESIPMQIFYPILAVNEEKAKSLASLLRLQLPTTLQAFDCIDNISPNSDTVKNESVK